MTDTAVDKAKRLLGLKLAEISLVESPASDDARVMFIQKSGAAVPFRILKRDDARRRVYGIAAIATKGGKDYVDSQGDVVPIDELQDSAVDFMLSGGVAGANHEKIGVGRVFEAVTLSREKQQAIVDGLAERGIKASMDLNCEPLWIGMRIDDPQVWKAVMDQRLRAFSIGGTAKRVEKHRSEPMPAMSEEATAAINEMVAAAVTKSIDALKPELAKLAAAAPGADIAKAFTPPGETAADIVGKLAGEIVTKSGLTMTIEQARARIWKSRPDLYRRHREEQRAAETRARLLGQR